VCAPASAATVTLTFDPGTYTLDYVAENVINHYTLGGGYGFSIDTVGVIADGVLTTTQGFALHLDNVDTGVNNPAARVLYFDVKGPGSFLLKSDFENQTFDATADFATFGPLGSHRFGMSIDGNTIQIDNIVVDLGAAVPEPATWALMIAGFGMAGAAARRRNLALA
jgi:hypothetical protein